MTRQDLLKKLREIGLNVIPLLPKSKKPSIEWKQYQEEQNAEIISDDNNIGIICGKTSGNLVVIDIDKKDLDLVNKIFPDALKKTLVVESSKGYHVYTRVPELPNTLRLDHDGVHIDIQSQGTLVTAPSSIHETGIEYKIISEDMQITHVDFRQIQANLEKIGFKVAHKPVKEIIKGGIGEGSRHNAALSYCNFLLFTKGLDDTAVEREMQQWNKSLHPPLPSNELEMIIKDCINYYKTEKNEQIYSLTNLVHIEDPTFANKKVNVKAIVASNSISYNVPNQISVKCSNTDDEHSCPRQKIVDIQEVDLVQFVEINDSGKNRILKNIAVFGRDCQINCDVIKSTTLKKLRLRPVVSSLEKNDGKFFDNEGNEWKAYDVYLQQDNVQSHEAGKEIQITGTVIPDPKSQRVTVVVTDAKMSECAQYDISKIKELQNFFQGKTVDQIMDWITIEFEKYSKIIKRQNVCICGLLTFFSPIHFKFEGKDIPGWVKSLILGDSTTGKSETVRYLISLLKNGQIISGETASVAGIGATATQSTNNQWFVEFGTLVLQDRKLLAIDGAHKLNHEHWATLAEAEREGKLKLTKAAKGEAYARTRQIKIMNPIGDDFRTTRAMKGFVYPVQAIQNNLQLQNIARQDLAIFVIDDVQAEERNTRNNQSYDSKLEYLSDLLNLVWEQKYDVIFKDDAIEEILSGATLLENKFKHEGIPLITNDQKYKLAKLSASLAALTCSFENDYGKLIITKEHVQHVSDFIDTEYANAGLDSIADDFQNAKINDEILENIVASINSSLERNNHQNDEKTGKEILEWVTKQAKFTREVMKERFELARDSQMSRIIAILKDESIIRQVKGGFSPTSRGVEIGKYIQQQFLKKEGVLAFGTTEDTKDTENCSDSSDPSDSREAETIPPDEKSQIKVTES